jgi:hypothetical protein
MNKLFIFGALLCVLVCSQVCDPLSNDTCSDLACCLCRQNPNFETGAGFYEFDSSCLQGGLNCIQNTGCRLCSRKLGSDPSIDRPLCLRFIISKPPNLTLTSDDVLQVKSLWESNFPNVTIITSPDLGFSGILTLSHGFDDMPFMLVNGIKYKSPLFTMALLSSEIAEDEDKNLYYAHAYEVMWVNYPNKNGTKSNVGQYVEYLWNVGLEVHSDHYHWKTAELWPAVHHTGIDITPLEFSKRTIDALKLLMRVTDELDPDKESSNPATATTSK